MHYGSWFTNQCLCHIHVKCACVLFAFISFFVLNTLKADYLVGWFKVWRINWLWGTTEQWANHHQGTMSISRGTRRSTSWNYIIVEIYRSAHESVKTSTRTMERPQVIIVTGKLSNTSQKYPTWKYKCLKRQTNKDASDQPKSVI